MSAQTIFFRLRIRNAANSADTLVVTSVKGGTNPYLSTTPAGDGASYDPATGESMFGSYTGRIADWSIGSSQRIVTSQLEDAGARQQLGYRRAFLEWSYDGATWTGGTGGGALIAGYLTLLRLVNAAEWEYTIQDPMAALVSANLFSPASTTPIRNGSTGFLDLWPNRGCLLGGPIMLPPVTGKPARMLGIDDLGGWKMRVETSSIAGQYYLRPINVYGPDNNWQSAKQINESLAQAINGVVAEFQGAFNNGAQAPWTTVGDTQTNYWAWNGVTVLIDSGSGFVPWKPLAYIYGPLADPNGNLYAVPLVSPKKGSTGTGLRVQSDGTRALTNGTTVRVRVLTVLPTEACPIYLSDHPVAILTTLLTAAGFAYNATSASTLTALIGADARETLRITSASALTDLVNDVCRMWGIGLRGDDAAAIYFFNGRDTSKNAAPTVTVTAADVVDGSTSLPFELDAQKSYRTVTIAEKRFVDQRVTTAGGKRPVVDAVAVVDDSQTIQNGDPGSAALADLSLSSAGMLHTASVLFPVIATFFKALALAIFDRFGRGPIALETTLLRGGAGDTLQLGDEAFVQFPQLPNLGYRLGDNLSVAARRMQIVRRTVLPSGYAVRFLDSGPNTQPLPTVPTLSVAGSIEAPRSLAQVTITNAATLNALGYGARLQMAITTGGAPSLSQYVDVHAWSASEGIPTGAINLSPAAAGSTVYVRARSEKPGSLASNYGTAASVALSTMFDPTSLTALTDVSDGSHHRISWTPGSGTSGDLVDIWLRVSGAAFSAAVKVATLPAGSVTYAFDGLTPNTAYVASVQYRDPATQDVGDSIDVAFTTGTATVTLASPSTPTPFSGSQDSAYGFPQQDGVYGLAVAAEEFPGFTEFHVAVETSPGSGAYGTASVVATMSNVQSDWTLFELVAPNDGLRRQITARHVRDGATPSAYTDAVAVLPWTSQFLPAFATAVQRTSILRITETESADATTATLALLVGTAVHHVQAYYRTVPRDQTGDVADFSDSATLPTDGVLVARAVAGAASFAFPQPARDKRLIARLVPWYFSPSGEFAEGESVVFPVNPAPPSINVQLHATKISGTVVNVSLDVAVGTSDVPATLTVIETIAGVDTTLLTVGITGNVTLNSASYPVLGGRSIPSGVQSASWRAVLTDVGGAAWLFGPVTALSDVPSLTAQYQPLTGTTGQIVWSCTAGIVLLSIDGGAPSTPSASPIPITLDSSTHNYAFTATLGGQTVPASVTVPALPQTALPIVYLYNSAQSTTADTITMQWTVTNVPPTPTYDLLWSNDRGATITTIAGVSTPYVHNKLGTGGHGYDIVAGGTITTLQYAIVVKSAGVTVAQSAWRDVDVDHA